jgi:hypothetical protein
MVKGDDFAKERNKKPFMRQFGYKTMFVRLNNFNLDNEFEVYHKSKTHKYLKIPACFPKQKNLNINKEINGYLLCTGRGWEAIKGALTLFEGEKRHPEFYVWIEAGTGVYRAEYVKGKIVEEHKSRQREHEQEDI